MKIISLAPSNTEILYEIGAEEQIVATTSLCDYPPEAREKENLGGWSNGLKVEKVIEMDPDIALASDSLQNEAVEKLEGKDVNVRQFKPRTLEEVYESIHEVGQIVGREHEAQKTVNKMRNQFKELSIDNTRIYCEEWMDPPMVSGNWILGIIDEIGGEYFIPEGKRSRKFDFEALKEFNPEYIFLNVCGAGRKIDLREIKERNQWKSIQAVSQDRIFVIDDALLNRPGPRLVEGAEKIAEKIN